MKLNLNFKFITPSVINWPFHTHDSNKKQRQKPRGRCCRRSHEAEEEKDNQQLQVAAESIEIDGIFEGCVMVSEKSRIEDDNRATLMLFKGIDYLRVIGLSNNNLTCLAQFDLGHLPKSTGHIVVDSKLFIIGGDLVNNSYPCDVWVCDFNGIGDWEIGPRLNGGKPNPVIFVVNGKIYVISGRSRYGRPFADELDPLFEVFDFNFGVWLKLPNPPFDYAYNYSYFPEFSFHVVVENVLYLRVKLPVYEGDVRGERRIFSFDLIREVWCDHGDEVDPRGCPNIVRNMCSVGWDCSGDVFKGKQYLLQTTSKTPAFCVYDMDTDGLQSKDNSLKMEKDAPVYEEYSRDEPKPQVKGEVDEFNVNPAYKHMIGRRTPHLVTGLDEIFSKLPKNGMVSWQLVPTDEVNSAFCLVCFFVQDFSQEYCVLLSTFELEQYGDSHGNSGHSLVTSSLHAQKLRYNIFPIDDSWGQLMSFYKVLTGNA